MKELRKIIKIDEELCNGCGQCVPDCAEGSLRIVNGKAKLVADKLCDGLGACLGSCPTGALTIEEREADIFDEDAVEEFLAKEKMVAPSLLSHWPVQLRLVPPHAPFLKRSDLLIAADCTAVAARNFQEKYLVGKVVAMGCPKFDDQQFYTEKLSQIFQQAELKSVTVLIMDVPCCSAMAKIVKTAQEQTKIEVPLHQIILSRNGVEQRSFSLSFPLL